MDELKQTNEELLKYLLQYPELEQRAIKGGGIPVTPTIAMMVMKEELTVQRMEVMCFGYGNHDEDWVGIMAEDFDYGPDEPQEIPGEYSTLEVWNEDNKFMYYLSSPFFPGIAFGHWCNEALDSDIVLSLFENYYKTKNPSKKNEHYLYFQLLILINNSKEDEMDEWYSYMEDHGYWIITEHL